MAGWAGRFEAWRRAAWRRRWWGVATAWLVCLLGWSLILWPADRIPGPASTDISAHQDGLTDRVAYAARDHPAADQVASKAAPASAVREEEGGQAEEADDVARRLSEALVARDAYARQLAELPAVVQTGAGPQPNPIHQQLKRRLADQDALIALLERRLLERQRGSGRSSDVAAMVLPTGIAPAGASELRREEAARATPSASAPVRSGVGSLALLAVFVAGAIAGIVVAVLRGRLDLLIDGAPDLRRFAVPLLGGIGVPARAAARAWIATSPFGLACLLLVVLLGGLLATRTLLLPGVTD